MGRLKSYYITWIVGTGDNYSGESAIDVYIHDTIDSAETKYKRIIDVLKEELINRKIAEFDVSKVKIKITGIFQL